MSKTRSYRSVLLCVAAAAVGVLWLATPAKAWADDTYAAIAYSEKTGHYGYGYNFDTREAAEERSAERVQGRRRQDRGLGAQRLVRPRHQRQRPLRLGLRRQRGNGQGHRPAKVQGLRRQECAHRRLWLFEQIARDFR